MFPLWSCASLSISPPSWLNPKPLVPLWTTRWAANSTCLPCCQFAKNTICRLAVVSPQWAHLHFYPAETTIELLQVCTWTNTLSHFTFKWRRKWRRETNGDCTRKCCNCRIKYYWLGCFHSSYSLFCWIMETKKSIYKLGIKLWSEIGEKTRITCCLQPARLTVLD